MKATDLLLRWVLRLITPEDDRHSLLADFDEEAATIAASNGRRAATRWRRQQVLRSLTPLLHRRLCRQPLESTPMSTLRLFFGHVPFGLRLLRRSPLSSAAVIIAIALGVAATTTVASVTESALLRPLPFDEPSALVALTSTMPTAGEVPETNYQDALHIRAESQSLESLAVYDADSVGVRAWPEDAPVSAVGLSATRELQDVLRIRPVVGRLFLAEDFRPGSDVAIIAHRLWRTRYASRADVVGQPVFIGSRRMSIVGVLPPQAEQFPAGGSDVWLPLVFPSTSFLNQRGSMALLAVARLRPAATVADANAELAVISSRLASQFPASNENRRVQATPLRDAMNGPVRPMLLLLASGIAVVLLVACANIGNLLLAQSHSRRREFAVRIALGASRRDLNCQLAAETAVLCGIAGIIGVSVTPLLTRIALSLYPEALPLAGTVELNGTVLAFALGVTLMTALVAGVPRTRSLGRRDIELTVISDGRATRAGLAPRMSTVLTAVQVLFTVVLISTGGLLLRTLTSISAVHPGFDPAGLQTIQVSIPPQPSPVAMAARQDAIRDVAATIPGVTSAAHAMFIPFTPGSWADRYEPLGTADPETTRPLAHFFVVSPDYLDTLGVPLVAGRPLTAHDNESAQRVIVISRQFSRVAFGDDAAIGRRINWGGTDWEVVGVTADTHHASLWDAPDGDVYVPRRQMIRGATWIVLRTSGADHSVSKELQTRLSMAGITATIVGAAPMQDRMARVTAPTRFRALLASALAVIAMCLAAIGVYSLTAFGVTQRVRDIGLRMALGATRGSVVRAEVVGSWRAVAAGLVPGLVVSLMLQSWLGTWLNGLTSSPWVTVVSAAVLFGVLSTVAAWLPARRASRIDPLEALRSE